MISSSPLPKIEWFKSIKNVYKKFGDGAVLDIKNVNKSSSGNYLVKVYSVEELNTVFVEKTVKVNVYEPLRWIRVPHSKIIQIGSNVTFKCLPNSNSSRVVWLRNGIPIESKENSY